MSKKENLKIEYADISLLKRYERNAKIHTKQQVSKLVQSMKTFGVTLNILLSFAQFEREVTGERIRDKIAASKKKGMWMGGKVPLGYLKEDKKLIIHNEDAQKVQMLFDKYLELRSVPKLMQYLKENEIKTKTDKYFSKGQLYHLLANKVYIGKITHKDNIYDGEHEAIICDEIFEEVQKLLYENKVDKTCGVKSSSNSLLVGLIYDDLGNKMTPSHSNSHGRRYRYYISRALKNNEETGSVSKIPAGEVEKFVIETTKEFLKDKKQIQNIVSEYKISKQNKLIYIAQNIQNYSEPKLIRAIINKIVVSKNIIEITYNEASIKKVLNALANNQEIVIPDKNEELTPIIISKNIKITQPSRNDNILILNAKEYDTPEPNPYLVNAIVKSFYYHKQIQTGKTIEDLQTEEGLRDSKYIRNMLNLKYIPPELTEQILNGTQAKELSLQRLIKVIDTERIVKMYMANQILFSKSKELQFFVTVNFGMGMTGKIKRNELEQIPNFGLTKLAGISNEIKRLIEL